MDLDVLNIIVKAFGINLLIFYVNNKITFTKIKHKEIGILIFASCIITTIYTILTKYFDNLLNIIVSFFIQLIVLSNMDSENRRNNFISNLMANAIVYVGYIIAILIEVPLAKGLNLKVKCINFIFIFLIEMIILMMFFRIKRFKRGFTFLNNVDNEMVNTILLNISSVVILIYYISGNYYGNLTKQLVICFLILGIIMIIVLRKTLTLYYKQKLLAKNIEDYKSEIALKDAQIKSLSDEKYKISKLNHEFYNRQKALIHKVEEITSMNTEIADELDLSKQINDLTKEYTDKAQEIKTLDKLPTTGIVEIDDMFKYMQSECDSKKIQFNLKINGNIYHMINNKIPQSRLVTLIGDHLRDAIIAIDFSNNTFKSILAVLGENNGVYEFCVFDTGIEFEIDTLLNLGLKPATTHKDSGGTGIGFITTFETMKETKASLIIDEMREMSNTDYTKSVTIRFDGKNEYRIKSYRSDEIKKKMKDNRIIIEE